MQLFHLIVIESLGILFLNYRITVAILSEYSTSLILLSTAGLLSTNKNTFSLGKKKFSWHINNN